MRHNSIEALRGTELKDAYVHGDAVHFVTNTDEEYALTHIQECCESVTLEEVIGDIEDLVGSPILQAEEVSGETPAPPEDQYYGESYTWTFYKLATIKGSVTLRWLGVSNGYYSESVDFVRLR